LDEKIVRPFKVKLRITNRATLLSWIVYVTSLKINYFKQKSVLRRLSLVTHQLRSMVASPNASRCVACSVKLTESNKNHVVELIG
jgi:uncharacterized protein with PIN domain